MKNLSLVSISFVLASVILVGLSPFYFSEAAESQDDIVIYIKDVSSIMIKIMTTVNAATRGIQLNFLPMSEGVRRMDTYIERLASMQYPEDLSRLQKMILLSSKKMRMGLLLFSVERKEMSVGLIKNGARLLKYAANDILEITEREGLMQGKERGEDIKADFVSILTEEDLKAMEEASRSRSTVAPEEDSLPSKE
ncbi:MAG: hypothetical protein V3S13_03530 [Candidatus Omnitrophota bacterium]